MKKFSLNLVKIVTTALMFIGVSGIKAYADEQPSMMALE
jgi:hypothetical protein